jgi:hypothetical protein
MTIEEFSSVDFQSLGLLACLRLTDGDFRRSFSAEDILVEAWKMDHATWGLRGHELEHPDSEKIKELNRRGTKDLVGKGWIERVDERIYRLTNEGLHQASCLVPGDAATRSRVNRELESSIRAILEHVVFKAWLSDPAKPKYFREAGHFWGIAPGTPPGTVRERISAVDRVLSRAVAELDASGSDEIGVGRRRLLFDRQDIGRCAEFQDTLKKRFQKELRLLDSEFATSSSGSVKSSPTVNS